MQASIAGPSLPAIPVQSSRSLLPQHEVECKTATHMLSWLSQVVQEALVVASGAFQGVRQEGQTVEGPVGVRLFGQVLDCGGQPGRGEFQRLEGVAEDAAEESGLPIKL